MNTATAPEQNRQVEDVRRIGERMSKPDWQEAINLLKAKSPEVHGKVYIPKVGAEYGGQVLMVTDSHIVQRVGKGAAIAHDLNMFSNAKELTADIEAGRIKPGMQMSARYGETRGEAQVFTFDQHRANEMHKDLKEWAEQNITSSSARTTFLKHVDHATKDLAQGRPQQQQREAPPAPPRSHDRAR
ncbi:hypothetical protein J2W32_006468 [Variovorax boronicumulans]|uniref:KfrB domain-containing protein n=1 Tax=Variovorax boronicumulans TaxID=436515 RepID=A0AAW8D847_9BURK|nr:hypothetical protein [Variovorax boronicumulans]MDP9897375.1 hypothetical protein [Variovorax boronicumulans]MDQ0057391.1 hypothetical protein [Variovorax boronicumulans]